MKGLIGRLACIILIATCCTLGGILVQVETHADRWNERVTSLEHVEKLNMDLVRAMEFSDRIMETTCVLAGEFATMCQRDAKMVSMVAAFEEENRALKNSLLESVDRLEDQLEQINDLFEENEDLQYEIDDLEFEAAELQKHIDTLELAVKKLTEITMPEDEGPQLPAAPITDADGKPVKGPE